MATDIWVIMDTTEAPLSGIGVVQQLTPNQVTVVVVSMAQIVSVADLAAANNCKMKKREPKIIDRTC
jgi:hypothetical protein